jgi:hypothetical protein
MTRRKKKATRLQRYRLRFTRRPPSAMWEALLVILFGAVMIYGYSFAKKITYGADAEAQGPVMMVRVQVLNGCGVKGAAGDITESLLKANDPTYQFDVVDEGNFATFDVTETLVLDRGESREAARAIADRLGVDSDHVLSQPLSGNVLDIDVSILLGRDFTLLKLPRNERRP